MWTIFFFFEMERNVRFQIKTDTLRRVRRRVGECCSYVFPWSVGNQMIIKGGNSPFKAYDRARLSHDSHFVTFSKWT